MKRWLHLALAIGLLACSLRAADPEATRLTTNAVGPVFVIPISGTIDPSLLYIIRRGASEAQKTAASAVVFQMDTPGGRLQETEEICKIIQALPMPVYTLVEKNAFSAGAIIAMGTKKIFMQPGSVIGAAMPIMVAPGGEVQDMPDDVKEKMSSAVSALIRANAQQNGHDPELAECMVRRDKEYRIGTNVISREGRLLTLTDVEAARTLGPDSKPLLSAGTVANLEELLAEVGLPGAVIHRLEVSSAEKIARWIAAIAPLLLMCGILGIYIEIKTPGLGLPGILGGICLALFFWGHHIAGLTGMEEVLLFIVGVVLVIVEIYVFPGHILPGIAGLCCMLVALLMSMTFRMPEGPLVPAWDELRDGVRTLGITVAGCAVAMVALARYLPGSRIASPLVLSFALRPSDGLRPPKVREQLVGQTGTATCALRPAGTALIGGVRHDVVSRGSFIAAGERIRVVAVEGSRMVVDREQGAAP